LRPDPGKVIQHLCLDKGYDNPTGEAACAKGGYVPHIRRIGQEKKDGWARRPIPRTARSSSAQSPDYNAAAHSRSATTRSPPTTRDSSNSPAHCCGTADATTDYKPRKELLDSFKELDIQKQTPLVNALAQVTRAQGIPAQGLANPWASLVLMQ
jgi:hypothetical protein